MRDVVEEVRGGFEKFQPMSRGEKAVWAAAYANSMSNGYCAHVAVRTAASRVRVLREEVAHFAPDMPPEEAHMAREVVNLEAALGAEYREQLRRVVGAVDRDVREVDDELASCMTWLDHRGYDGAAAVLRLEVATREGYERWQADDQVAALERARDAAAAEVVRLRGLGGKQKNRG